MRVYVALIVPVLLLLSSNVYSNNFICHPEKGQNFLLMNEVKGWEGGSHTPILGSITIAKNSTGQWVVKKLGNNSNFMECIEGEYHGHLICTNNVKLSMEPSIILFSENTLRFSYARLSGYTNNIKMYPPLIEIGKCVSIN